MAIRNPRAVLFRDVFDLWERADQLQRQFFHPGALAGERPSWQPPVDVFETREGILIVVALPGVPPERVRVAIEDGSVVVAGERALSPALRTATVHRLEIPYGRFERRIALPPGRYLLGAPEVVDGCLVVALRRTA